MVVRVLVLFPRSPPKDTPAMLRNFDDVVAPTRTATTFQVASSPPAVTETVTALPRPVAAAFVAKADENWAWDDLRDYVVTSIERQFGPFPRDVRKESGIFKSFLARFPGQAPAIARYAFEISGGFWMGSPVSVTRFCKASDPYFSEPIIKRLSDTSTPVQGW